MGAFCPSQSRGCGAVGTTSRQHCVFTSSHRGAVSRRVSIVAHGFGDDGITRPLQRLVEDLENAIDREEYELAASLRDEIQERREDNRLAVEEANEAFYDAFRRGDYVAMATIWGSGSHVQCIHPAAECVAGREDVLTSWKLILSSSQRMDIGLEDLRIYATDTHGMVTVVEVVDTEESKGRVVATNIFEKQKGKWKIVLHHGGPVPRK